MKNTDKEQLIHSWNVWITAWIEIFESIIIIVTLSLYRPRWSGRYILWYNTKSRDRKLIKMEEAYGKAIEIIEREIEGKINDSFN
jgi:hypothetical protein